MGATNSTQEGLPCGSLLCKHIGLSPYLYLCRDRKRQTGDSLILIDPKSPPVTSLLLETIKGVAV